MTVHPTDPSDVADYSDQTGFFDPASFAEVVTLIGCGGIGASILPTLVTMGFSRFVLWDDDEVEPRNIASQLLYKPSDLYRPKVEVCQEYLLAYGAREVEIHQAKLTADDIVEGVVIGGVDTMAARQLIWEVVQKCQPELYVDGRIGGEFMSLFMVEPFDGEWYARRWLFSDAEAAPLPCTQRAVAYPAVAMGAVMAGQLARWHRGEVVPKRTEFHLGDLFFQMVGKLGG